jgi:hypothetical protein
MNGCINELFFPVSSATRVFALHGKAVTFEVGSLNFERKTNHPPKKSYEKKKMGGGN